MLKNRKHENKEEIKNCKKSKQIKNIMHKDMQVSISEKGKENKNTQKKYKKLEKKYINFLISAKN